jgi:signal transduction histidine kinase
LIAFRDLSVRHKQLLAAVAVVVTALAVVISAFIAATFGYMRASAESELATQAAIVADSIAPAIAFDDEPTAADSLAALATRPTIDFACIYSRTGHVFARYVRDAAAFQCPAAAAAGRAVTLSHLTLEREIRERGAHVGTVVIQRNLTDVYDTVRFQILVTIVALALGIAAAAIVALPLHRSIATPIIHLASTAREVSERGDYSIRARKQGNDEVGQLVDTFNQMLTDIGQRDRDLSMAAQERTRLLERETEANRVKDEFLAALSHELRTPLNAIAGWIQILQKTPPSQEILTKALSSIERNTRAQSRLIEDLLDVSRIVSGKLTLKTEAADLGRIVDAVAEGARSAAAGKGIALTCVVPTGPCLVSGDADRLQQVVWNLLSNAIKFTPAGGQVTVTMSGGDGVYTVEVVDTGVGIDASFLPFVFDRFRQADGSVTREHGGLGLGLAIARDILDLHGGRITAHSEGRNRGSRFVLELPALLGRELVQH